MKITPIKTRPLVPPQDDLIAVIKASALNVKDNDVLCISSKVVAIHEGRCEPLADADKETIRESDADLIIPRDYWSSPLTAVHHTFLSGAGGDTSNGNGYLIRTPSDPFESAHVLHAFLTQIYNLTKLGVIITDSRSMPFRYGASGVALGWWGIQPLKSHIGEPDIFGRELKYERSNVVDAIAAAATLVMGETNECQPLAVVQDVPGLRFTDKNTKDELFSPYEDDTFRVLYEKWLG